MEEQKQTVVRITGSLALFTRGITQWKSNIRVTALAYLLLTAPSLIVTILQKLFLPYGWADFIVRVAVFVLGSWASLALILAACEQKERREPGDYIGGAVPFLLPYMLACVVWFAALVVAAIPGFLVLGFLVAVQSVPALIGLSVFAVLWLAAWVSAAVYSAVRFPLFGFACALELRGPLASLRRSWEWCNRQPATVIKVMLWYFGAAFALNIPIFIAGAAFGRTVVSEVIVSILSFALSVFLIPAQTYILAVLHDNVKEAA